VKITVNGEKLAYEFELGHVLMSQALAIEKAASRRYVEWESEVIGGSAEALAALVHLAWKDSGRDVPVADILDGKADFNFVETYASFMDGLREQQAARAAAQRPTSGAEPLTDPDGTGTTPAATSGRSQPSSASARGKSGS
jgi:hypothetical protein